MAAKLRDAAVYAARMLQEAGHKAYFAGGCVRDEILGHEPSDYDVATSATPDQVEALFPGAGLVGKSFGVVIVRIGRREGIDLPDPGVIEIATFRRDGTYSDARRPDSVEFADDVEDARRRDFTVNAMFLDPLDPDRTEHLEGRVIDHVDGWRDLRAGIVRAVGDPEARLAEDHLRSLRAARFAARLGFEIHEDTARAISRHTRDLASVSAERIGDEFRRMLAHPSRARAVDLLRELGLADAILGEHRAGEDTLSSIPAGASLRLSLASLASDTFGAMGHKRAGEWANRVCLSNAERLGMLDVLSLSAQLEGASWDDQGVAPQKRVLAHDAAEDALRLLAARAPQRHAIVRARLDELKATPSGLAPDPLLRGEDLIGLGVEPGPRFGEVLDGIYDLQLEDRLTTRDEALAEGRRMFGI